MSAMRQRSVARQLNPCAGPIMRTARMRMKSGLGDSVALVSAPVSSQMNRSYERLFDSNHATRAVRLCEYEMRTSWSRACVCIENPRGLCANYNDWFASAGNDPTNR